MPTLDIDDGVIDLGTVVDAPFGTAMQLDLDELSELDAWLDEHDG